MNVPQLPGSPHLPTLGYLLGILGLVALGVVIWLAVRRGREA